MKTNIKTIIRKTRVSVGKLCEEYGVAKQTVSDIKKAKPKLMEYAAQYCVDATASKSGKGLPRTARRLAADIISTPRTLIPTDRSCTYHFITAASNPVSLAVFICFLGNPFVLVQA